MNKSIIHAHEHHNTSTNDVQSGLLLLQSPLEALELQIMTTHPHLHIQMGIYMDDRTSDGKKALEVGLGFLNFGSGLVWACRTCVVYIDSCHVSCVSS